MESERTCPQVDVSCLSLSSFLRCSAGAHAAPLAASQRLPGGAEARLHGARVRGGEVRLRGGPGDFPKQGGHGETFNRVVFHEEQNLFKLPEVLLVLDFSCFRPRSQTLILFKLLNSRDEPDQSTQITTF